jgi:mRNA-degrading endonuclease toxin of MazEF toxin-antitoxin module
VIRRGCIYRVAGVFRDPKPTRLVLVMTADARNLDARSPAVVGIPITTSLKGGMFRVRLARGSGGLPQTSEVACEQIVQVPTQSFVGDGTRVHPLGPPLEESVLDEVVSAVVHVIGG